MINNLIGLFIFSLLLIPGHHYRTKRYGMFGIKQKDFFQTLLDSIISSIWINIVMVIIICLSLLFLNTNKIADIIKLFNAIQQKDYNRIVIFVLFIVYIITTIEWANVIGSIYCMYKKDNTSPVPVLSSWINPAKANLVKIEKENGDIFSGCINTFTSDYDAQISLQKELLLEDYYYLNKEKQKRRRGDTGHLLYVKVDNFDVVELAQVSSNISLTNKQKIKEILNAPLVGQIVGAIILTVLFTSFLIILS